MVERFTSRGYPHSVLQEAQRTNEVVTSVGMQENTNKKEKNKKRIAFVRNHHPLNNKVDRIIKKHWSILNRSFPEVEEFKTPPLMCNKCTRNLRDQSVRADLGSDYQSPRHRLLSTKKAGTYPCCAQCTNVIKGDTFYHPHTGRAFKMKGYHLCVYNVIYSIKCPCGLLYVGETSQQVKARISKHKSAMRTNNLLLPIPFHFHKQGHSVITFQIIEQVTLNGRGGDIKKLLWKREAFWIHKRCTLEAKGLNRDYEIAHMAC